MKVLTFTTLFPHAEASDFGIFIKNRMKAFSLQNDVQLKVVAPVPWFPPIKISSKWYSYSQIPKFEIIDDIEVYHPRYLVTPKIGMTFYWLWMFLGSIGCIRMISKKYTFDLIDAHFIYPDGLAAIFLGLWKRVPVVVSARGTDVNLYPQFPIINSLIRMVLKHADHILAVSRSLRDIMVKEGASPEKISVIPNGIDPNRFYVRDMKLSRRRLNIKENHKVLITVGGLIERKGTHLLVDALYLLHREGIALQTYIIGKGELRPMLEEKIAKYGLSETVTLVGQVPNHELLDWYNGADLFFLGSSREGWPNVVCEAQACGVPVVATAVHGIPEILDSDDLGIMVERNPNAFAAGIKQAMNRPWNRKMIAENGRQRTWKNVATEVRDLFSAVINNAKN